MRGDHGHFGLGAFLPASGFAAFIDHAVPELRRREVFRAEGSPGGERKGNEAPLARERSVMSEGRLDLRHVSKTFQVDGQLLKALDNIDLTVAPGEFVVIVGASGCGKSTFLRIAAGLETKHSGQVLHDARPVTRPSL